MIFLEGLCELLDIRYNMFFVVCTLPDVYIGEREEGDVMIHILRVLCTTPQYSALRNVNGNSHIFFLCVCG